MHFHEPVKVTLKMREKVQLLQRWQLLFAPTLVSKEDKKIKKV